MSKIAREVLMSKIAQQVLMSKIARNVVLDTENLKKTIFLVFFIKMFGS